VYYFIISNDIVSELLQFKVLDNMINYSDLLPILLTLNLPVSMPDCTMHDVAVDCIKRLPWDHADLAHYYSYSYELLQPIHHELNSVYANLMNDNVESDYGTHCDFSKSVGVSRTDGITIIKSIYCKIVNCLNNVAARFVPSVKVNRLKFWWDQELNELKNCATVSHRAWVEAGKPNVGVISDARKKDKYSYRHKIRQGQAKEKSNIRNSLHDALINEIQGSFWKMWKSKFGIKNSNHIPLMVRAVRLILLMNLLITSLRPAHATQILEILIF